MRFPFVSRERYDELKDAHVDLLEQYHKLLAERAPSKPEPREPRPAKPPRDQMVDKIAADLEAGGLETSAARSEAERLKREAFGGSL